MIKIKHHFISAISFVLFIFVLLVSCTPADNAHTQSPLSQDTNETDENMTTPVETGLSRENPDRLESIPNNAVKMTPEQDLYPPILHSDEFLEPVPMPWPINTAVT